MRKPFSLVFGGVLLVGVSIASVREYMTRHAVTEEIKKLEANVKELEERKTSLLATLEYFQSPLFQEQEAREKLGLTKQGETVVVLPEVRVVEPEIPAKSQNNQIETSAANPVRWWQFFFGA